jgi:hypothetical protein
MGAWRNDHHECEHEAIYRTHAISSVRSELRQNVAPRVTTQIDEERLATSVGCGVGSRPYTLNPSYPVEARIALIVVPGLAASLAAESRPRSAPTYTVSGSVDVGAAQAVVWKALLHMGASASPAICFFDWVSAICANSGWTW